MDEWGYSLDKLSDKSLLVSTSRRVVLRFYCPIKARCSIPVAGHLKGDEVFIEGIKQTKDHELLYLIEGLHLPHTYFEIQS